MSFYFCLVALTLYVVLLGLNVCYADSVKEATGNATEVKNVVLAKVENGELRIFNTGSSYQVSFGEKTKCGEPTIKLFSKDGTAFHEGDNLQKKISKEFDGGMTAWKVDTGVSVREHPARYSVRFGNGDCKSIEGTMLELRVSSLNSVDNGRGMVVELENITDKTVVLTEASGGGLEEYNDINIDIQSGEKYSFPLQLEGMKLLDRYTPITIGYKVIENPGSGSAILKYKFELYVYHSYSCSCGDGTNIQINPFSKENGFLKAIKKASNYYDPFPFNANVEDVGSWVPWVSGMCAYAKNKTLEIGGGVVNRTQEIAGKASEQYDPFPFGVDVKSVESWVPWVSDMCAYAKNRTLEIGGGAVNTVNRAREIAERANKQYEPFPFNVDVKNVESWVPWVSDMCAYAKNKVLEIGGSAVNRTQEIAGKTSEQYDPFPFTL